jgi:membrane-bound lytic murein transglycosylase D
MVRKYFLLLAGLLFVGDAAVAQTNSYSTTLFPTPDVLTANVEFWKNIYARYSEREVVIHDSEDLGIVYEVVNRDSLFRGANVSDRLQWKRIDEIKKQYKSILLKLSQVSQPAVANFSDQERQVAALFGWKWSSARLKRAAGNIRAQSGLKERFKLGIEKSGLYLDKMREIFRTEELPLELLVLPHVESSFNYKAYSKLGAAGIWQFTRPTARHYMKVNYEVDERLDPLTATYFAAKHLKNNYSNLGSWPLAITAYNHGLNGMKRARNSHGDDLGRIVQNYQSRSFGFASRNFYAEFLAALHVTNNYRYYFGDIDFHKPAEFITFETPDFVTTKSLLKLLEIDADEFADLNPALRPPVLQSKRRIPKRFKVRVPMRENLDVAGIYARISPGERFEEQVRPEWHTVVAGENLSIISRRYGISVGELIALNDIGPSHLIYVGQNLQIPSLGGVPVQPPPVIAAAPVVKETPPPQLAEADLRKKDPTSVMDVPPVTSRDRGVEITQTAEVAKPKPEVTQLPSKTTDSAHTTISTKAELSPVEVQEFVTRAATVEEEMELALPDFYVEMTREMETRVVRVPQHTVVMTSLRTLDFPQNGQVRVEPDETLGHFADWLEVPTQKLRSINRLSYSAPIHIEQPLWLSFENVTPEEFHRRRLEYHQGIEEDFFTNYNVVGETAYKVQRGENIWTICNREFEFPYWLIKRYNQETDLLRLTAGQEIVVPIVEAKTGQGVVNEKL